MKKNSKKLTISCLCSVYRNSVLKEVKMAIESILNGSETPDEIIVVIDGLIDNNLKRYLLSLEESKKIKTLTNTFNLGLGLALSHGLKNCSGDLICRFDTDDINLYDRIKISKEAFKKNTKLDVFSSSVLEIIPSKKKTVDCNLKFLPTSDKSIKSTLEIRNSINHPSVIFKKDLALKLGSYEDVKFFEDYYLWLKFRKNKCTFKNTKEPLVIMRREDPSQRRLGLKYAIYEFKFYLKVLSNNLAGPIFFIFTPFKILLRLLPKKFQYLLRFVPWRKKYTICNNPDYLKIFNLKSLEIK